ncbi:MAG: nitrate reductase [Verrucomicrobiota bacterium]
MSSRRQKLLPSKNLLPPLRAWDGELTQRLVQAPGEFGLGRVPEKVKPDSTTSMICGFCSTGCSLNIHRKEGEAVNLTPDPDYPVNIGMACPKGWEALAPLDAPDRATVPMIREERAGELKPLQWTEAAKIFCDRMKAVQAEHGKESVAFLSTGQICTEEMAFLGAFAKFGMGVKHGDGNTRQCMATSVVSYKQSFGFDAPPYTYKDFEDSDVIVLVGSNLCIAHPIMWQRVLRNKNNPEIIVIDPRRTETAMEATRHVPILPKSDLRFFYGLANVLISEGWVDREFIEAHTNEFEAFATHVRSYTPERVARHCGIDADDFRQLAELIHRGKRVSFWWTMGVNQGHEAVRTAQAIINLALMTGNIGRPGTGANSITGQCNAMGSRLFSNTTNLLGGHDFAHAPHREKIARIIGVDESKIPQEPSWAYDQIIDGIESGKIKGLWVIATNTAHSWINQSRARRLLDKLDFLVVQDMYHSTETAAHADLVLPAAGWAEKEGTFINSERRIGLVKKVAKAPGQALADFQIFRLLAEQWGEGEMFRKWSSPEAVFRILQKCSEGQPCDVMGIDGYREIDEAGGIQWPLVRGESLDARERRLFSDGRFYTKDEKAIFLYSDPVDPGEVPCGDFPYLLLTGRGSSAQWHTLTRTAKSSVLGLLSTNDPYVEINPEDAERLGIAAHDEVELESRRGAIRLRAVVAPTVVKGQVFVPMHFRCTNILTFAEFDKYSRQPSYKNSSVKVTRL